MLWLQKEHAEAEALKEDRRHDLARRIERSDAQIDRLVYGLCGSAEEEIGTAERQIRVSCQSFWHRKREEGKMDISIKRKLLEQLEVLPYEFQRRVLDFAQALALSVPKGVPGKQLLRFVGAIPEDDLQMMVQAIEAGCERIDLDEW
jgi:hypothetical protein